jgi:hypothetical protein
VFTQERLHILLAVCPELHIDDLGVDEAHKWVTDQRGVLLSTCERSSRPHRPREARVASPRRDNRGPAEDAAPDTTLAAFTE